MILPANQIAKYIGIDSSTDQTIITTLLTDSRDLTYPAETVFFALRTPGNDGHNYIPALIEQGVRHFVVAEGYTGTATGCTFWHVPSVIDALQAVAVGVRDTFPALPVVGITGSQGKTTVKELLYKLLRREFNVARSPRSYNSQIGVPLSVWTLTPDTTLAIFEAGISQPEEMEKLEPMIKPTVGIFTSLTEEHDAGFESMRQKAEEKAKLFVGCKHIFCPASSQLIIDVLKEKCPDARLYKIDGGSNELAIAAAMHIAVGAPIDESVIEAEDSIVPRIDVCPTLKDCIVVYDSFTNDMRSIADALNFTRRHATIGRTITVVLGCPFTGLQPMDAEKYAELKRLLKAKGVSRVIGVGFPDGIGDGDMEKVGSVDEFLEKYTISDFNREVILVKGEQSQGFEQIKSLLEAPRHETIMEVDLGAITRNFNYYRSLVRPGTGFVAMVKAAGYGVGSLELAKTLQSQGAAYLAVAVVDEGAELRRAGITMPIIVMNPLGTNYKALFDNRLEPSVFSLRELNMLIGNAKRLGITDYPVHIKLDTGMHRLGFLADELDELCEVLNSQKYVKVASIFSHLATADCLDQDEYTEGQLHAFDSMSCHIMERLPYHPLRHVLNTAGIMRYPQYQYDMVRLGIGLYGISPIPQEKKSLSVVASLYTTIISIKHWQPGITIGYGRKGKITQPATIATIPIGYADGLDRHLSNGGASVIVNGHHCPIVGNICMDQCMIDITGADAQIGDKVEVFGPNAPIERLSEALDTIPYEILTSISPRVKRIYFRD